MNQDSTDKERKAHEREKHQLSILNSGNTNAILTVLEEIREIGSLSLLPAIFDLMLVTDNDEIIRSCNSLLSDLKNTEARTYMVEAIQDDKYEAISQNLVAACWQSGFDYSEYIEVFTTIVLSNSFETSIEAFTVIENSLNQLNDSGKNKLILTLKSNTGQVEPEKRPLIEELIETVKRF
ncbi:hypothetical protein ACFLT1_04750 [Bacteroidota bacterium]